MEKKAISELGKEMNARVRALREHFGLSQVSFADKVKLGVGTIRNIEYDLTEPNPRYFEQIAEACGASVVWLETGEGEMFRKMTKREKIANFVSEALADESDDFKSQLILVLAALSEDGWKKLKAAAEELKKAEEKARSEDS